MTIVENGVNYSVKRYNDLRVMIERRTGELKSRLDELDFQRNSYEELNAMKKVMLCYEECLLTHPLNFEPAQLNHRRTTAEYSLFALNTIIPHTYSFL